MNRSLLLLTSLALLICSVGDYGARAQGTIFVPTCVGDASLDTAKFAAIKTRVAPTRTGTIKIPYAADPAYRCKLNTFVTGDNIVLDNTQGSGVFVVTGETLTAGPIVNPPDRQIFYNALGGQGKVKLSLVKEVFPQWWGGRGDWNGVSGLDNLAALKVAVAALPVAGGTIKIIPGDYRLSDSWVINRSNVTVLTTAGSVIRTTANTTGGETLVFRGSPATMLNNVHITGGGTITNRSTAPVHDNGIGFTSCRNWSVTAMRIVDVTRHGITAQEEVLDGLIADNYVEGADYVGIGVAQPSGTTKNQLRNIKIVDNTIKNTGTGRGAGANAGLAAIYADSTDDLVIANNVVDTVLGNASHARGIDVQNSDLSPVNNRLTITGNQVSSTAGAGFFVYGARGLNMTNNLTKSAGSHGFYIEASSDVTLMDLQTTAPSARGITSVSSIGTVIMTKCVVKFSGEDGIFINGPSMTSLDIQATVDGAGGADPAGMIYSAIYVNDTPDKNKVNVIITGTKHRYAVRNDGKNPLLISGSVTPGKVATFLGPVSWSRRASVSGAPWPLVFKALKPRVGDAFL